MYQIKAFYDSLSYSSKAVSALEEANAWLRAQGNRIEPINVSVAFDTRGGGGSARGSGSTPGITPISIGIESACRIYILYRQQ